ncbi:hypothetical protein [Pedobacter sp. L105]|uniref:hypothetical protein n=1 Tax=Pedobacter sp. L105 TaxID=1641871 RepID=UPI00131D26E8|nr:hypothetical protein [Pedobacter sp. L105]
MIILDKNTIENKIILTAVSTGVNTLVLHSDYTLKDITIQLDANLSNYKSYYSFFVLASDSFNQLNIGLYHYKHYLDDSIISEGMLKINDSTEVIPDAVIAQIEDNEYNVFRY